MTAKAHYKVEHPMGMGMYYIMSDKPMSLRSYGSQRGIKDGRTCIALCYPTYCVPCHGVIDFDNIHGVF